MRYTVLNNLVFYSFANSMFVEYVILRNIKRIIKNIIYYNKYMPTSKVKYGSIKITTNPVVYR